MLLNDKDATLEDVRKLAQWCRDEVLSHYSPTDLGVRMSFDHGWEYLRMQELVELEIMEQTSTQQATLGRVGKLVVLGARALEDALGIPPIVGKALAYFEELQPNINQVDLASIHRDRKNEAARDALVMSGLIEVSSGGFPSLGAKGKLVRMGKTSALIVLRKWALSDEDSTEGFSTQTSIHAPNSTFAVGDNNTIVVHQTDKALHEVVNQIEGLGDLAPQVFELLCRVRRLEETHALQKESLDDLEVEAFLKKVKPDKQEALLAVLKLAPDAIKAVAALHGFPF